MIMNTLNFDEKGCLIPYSIIKTDLGTLKKTFVFNEHRETLFNAYEDFNAELQNLTSCPLIQWMGGSFITLKELPKDIDTVTFIPFDIFDKYKNKLRELETKHRGNQMDCFFERLYSKKHSNYQDYISNTIYWHRLYSKFPVQKQAVRWLPKGFIDINFQ